MICSVLYLCRLMEETGSGFDKIAASYALYPDQYQPYVSSDSSSFTLTLPDVTYRGLRMVEGDLLPAVEADGILKGERDVLILSYCYPKERTAKEIASFLKIQPSTYFRKNVLGSLVSDGLLQARTAKRITTYMTNPARVRLKT